MTVSINCLLFCHVHVLIGTSLLISYIYDATFLALCNVHFYFADLLFICFICTPYIFNLSHVVLQLPHNNFTRDKYSFMLSYLKTPCVLMLTTCPLTANAV